MRRTTLDFFLFHFMMATLAPAAITVFDDPAEYNVKHPLAAKWTLWYDDGNMLKQNPKLTWKENLKKVHTFDCIEDFWGLNKYVKNPSTLPHSANYHLFKEGIEPMWEDPANKKGGKWTFSHSRTKRGPELDKYWLDSVAALLGGYFTQSDDISGIVISIRKNGDRISIWTKSSDEKEKTMTTGYFKLTKS